MLVGQACCCSTVHFPKSLHAAIVMKRRRRNKAELSICWQWTWNSGRFVVRAYFITWVPEGSAGSGPSSSSSAPFLLLAGRSGSWGSLYKMWISGHLSRASLRVFLHPQTRRPISPNWRFLRPRQACLLLLRLRRLRTRCWWTQDLQRSFRGWRAHVLSMDSNGFWLHRGRGGMAIARLRLRLMLATACCAPSLR